MHFTPLNPLASANSRQLFCFRRPWQIRSFWDSSRRSPTAVAERERCMTSGYKQLRITFVVLLFCVGALFLLVRHHPVVDSAGQIIDFVPRKVVDNADPFLGRPTPAPEKPRMHRRYRAANKRGAGKGEIAVLWLAGRAWPALPDRERWAA